MSRTAVGQRRPVLHLLIPGLFTPNPESAPSPGRLPLLESWLARADVIRTGYRDVDTRLCDLLGFPRAVAEALPAGALTRQAACGDAGTDCWFCVEPVHIEADHRELFVSAVEPDLVEDEAATLCAAIGGLAAGEDWSLLPTEAGHWHLRMPQAPALVTTPFGAVRGRSMRDRMPTGPDARRWCGWLTEVQMVLHDHPLNRAREASGKPVVNGVWLWGGGVLPQRCEAAAVSVWDDSRVTRALAQWAGVSCRPVPDDGAAWLRALDDPRDCDGVVVLRDLEVVECLTDPVARSRGLDRIERVWLPAFDQVLRSRRFSRVTIHPGDDRSFMLSSSNRWRWWRRPRALSAWCA